MNDSEAFNGYCLSCHKNNPKPEKKPYVMPKESAKRKEANKLDQKQNKEIKAKQPLCQIKSPDCTKWAQGCHHIEKRTPKNLTDVKNKLSACNACNSWVERHPLEAKQMKVSKNRIANN